MSNYDDWMAGFNGARALSDKLNLSFWVYNGSLYLQDGGKRGYSCTNPDDTYDGHHYEVWGEASSRNASEEETSMWELLTHLTSSKPEPSSSAVELSS
jgi:hypothetical protein